MEYANTFSLDFPVELWRPFAQDRPSVRCSSGYLIYLQGTEATCFYYLKKGKVKSFIQSEDGAERTLNLYQQGSIFGEASFFDELPRVSSAVALTPCEIVPIDREQVTAEFTRNPGMAMAMLKYLARTVRAAVRPCGRHGLPSGRVAGGSVPALRSIWAGSGVLYPGGDRLIHLC